MREELAHGWDLAVATGPGTELDPELGAFALKASRRSRTVAGVAGTYQERRPAGP